MDYLHEQMDLENPTTFAPISLGALPPPEPAVYVYGASGRVWKFANESLIRPYFAKLAHLSSDADPTPRMNAFTYLMDAYGANIAERLNMANLDRPSPQGIRHTIEIKTSDGQIHGEHPRAFEYNFRIAKIHIIITAEEAAQMSSMNYNYVLTKLLEGAPATIPFYERVLIIEYLARNTSEWRLLQDYLLGDRVVYTEPRPEPRPTEPRPTEPLQTEKPAGGWFSFLRPAPPAAQRYEQINING